MNAVYTQAIRYSVKARCVMPLRTGGGDTETVLRYENGRAFIQASSLAGAMREWLTKNETPLFPQKRNRSLPDILFGSQRQGGSLILSDGVFNPGADMQIRPHVKIDGRTGTAEDQKKYDIAHIQRDAEFRFTLTWLGEEKDPDAADSVSAIEWILSAMNCGEIRLGAQKSNGFGRLSLAQKDGSPSVTKTVYNLRSERDRTAWLELADTADGAAEYAEGKAPFAFPELSPGPAVIFAVRGRADSILVKSSNKKWREEEQEKQEAKDNTRENKHQPDVTINLSEQNTPILPGSSAKGALRSRVYAIAKLLNREKACDTVDALFGRGPEDSAESSLPGKENDNGIPGKVRCEDVLLPPEKGNRKELARVRLDRFTGGVIRQDLFWEEPVSGDITLQYTVPADQPVGCALILYALRDLGLKLWNLGSGASIGRGFLHVREIEVRTPEGKRLYLRDFYQKGRDGGESGLLSGTWSVEDKAGLWQAWDNALEEWRGTHEN